MNILEIAVEMAKSMAHKYTDRHADQGLSRRMAGVAWEMAEQIIAEGVERGHIGKTDDEGETP